MVGSEVVSAGISAFEVVADTDIITGGVVLSTLVVVADRIVVAGAAVSVVASGESGSTYGETSVLLHMHDCIIVCL